MTQPTRLIAPDGEATPLERALLESALDERPSPEASRHILAGTLAASSVAATTGLTSTAKAWLAITTVAVATAGAGVALLNPHASGDPRVPSSAREQGSTSSPQMPEPSALLAAPPAAAERQEAVEEAHDTASELAREPAAANSHSQSGRRRSSTTETTAETHASAGEANASSLREELELLDRARAAVQAGDARRAMELLASYDRRFPQGMLRHESQLLRKRADETFRR